MAATEISTRANAALDDLYRHHVGEVYRYTYAVLGNHADAEDVTQTTFVNALRALERGETPHNASSVADRDRAERGPAAVAPGGVPAGRGGARPRRAGHACRGGHRARRARARPPADPAGAARGARHARARGTVVQRDRRPAGAHDLRARDAALPRAPVPRRGARESRHVPERRARDVEAARRPVGSQGTPAARRAPRRVPRLRPAGGDAEAPAAGVQGPRSPSSSDRARALQGRAQRVRCCLPPDHRPRRDRDDVESAPPVRPVSASAARRAAARSRVARWSPPRRRWPR